MERASSFRDGLGERRALARNGGHVVELLYVRRELTATPSFEAALGASIERFAHLQHASFRHVLRSERIDSSESTLALVSEYIPGTRLSDLLSNLEGGPVALDIGAALCVVHQLTVALASLHDQASDIAHGALAPERLLLTDDGRVVILEQVLGAALESLQYTPERYWRELRVPVPRGAASGPVRFDRRLDVCALGVVSLSLVLGRAVKTEEYPGHVADVLASTWAISARGGFEPLPAGLRGWLGRALQFDPRNAFATAVEARTELDRVLTGELASAAHLTAFLEKYRAAFPPAPHAIEAAPPIVEVQRPQPTVVAPAPVPKIVAPPVTKTAAVAAPIEAPKTIPKEVPKQVPKQVPKDVRKEVPVDPFTAPKLHTPPAAAVVSSIVLPEDIEEEPVADPSALIRAAALLRSWPRTAAVAALVVMLVTGGAFAARRHGTVTAAPAEQSGTLILTSDPSGTPTTIDGEPRGATPLTIALPVGQHVVELHVGAVSRTVPITMMAGTKIAQYIELPKLGPMVGQLNVRTDPSGAQVSIDGVVRGPSPLVITDLSPGDHMVSVASDAGSARHAVTIEAGATASLTLPLAAPAAAAPSTGSIAVVSPIDVQVYEHDQFLGSSRTERIALSSGRHEIDLVNDALGYRITRTVQVAPGKASSIKIEVPRGTISLNAIPWAEVWIDGERAGETPIGNFSLPIGPHDIVLRHPDLGEAHQTAIVSLKEPARVSVDLRKK